MEIKNDPQMEKRIASLLLEEDPTSAIILDQHKAIHEKIVPGSFPEAKGAWPLLAARGMKIYRTQVKGRGAGMAGLADWGALFKGVVDAAAKMGTAKIQADAAAKAARQTAAAQKAIEEARTKKAEAEAKAAIAAARVAEKQAAALPARAVEELDAATGEARKKGLSKKAKVGIAIGAGVGGLGLLALLFLMLRRKK
jgi:hypothetical protein